MDKKRLTLIEIKVFRRTSEYTIFDHMRNEDILEEYKVEPVDEKLRRQKSELSTKCNENEQQQVAKNNAEL
jgi:hypothetical protein